MSVCALQKSLHAEHSHAACNFRPDVKTEWQNDNTDRSRSVNCLHLQWRPTVGTWPASWHCETTPNEAALRASNATSGNCHLLNKKHTHTVPYWKVQWIAISRAVGRAI